MTIKDEKVLNLFRGPGKCHVCGRYVSRREPHHILARGIGGGGRLDHPWNLIALCAAFSGGKDCHYKVHAATLTINDRRATREDLFGLVAIREGVPQHVIEDTLYELRRQPKGKSA